MSRVCTCMAAKQTWVHTRNVHTCGIRMHSHDAHSASGRACAHMNQTPDRMGLNSCLRRPLGCLRMSHGSFHREGVPRACTARHQPREGKTPASPARVMTTKTCRCGSPDDLTRHLGVVPTAQTLAMGAGKPRGPACVVIYYRARRDGAYTRYRSPRTSRGPGRYMVALW